MTYLRQFCFIFPLASGLYKSKNIWKSCARVFLSPPISTWFSCALSVQKEKYFDIAYPPSTLCWRASSGSVTLLMRACVRLAVESCGSVSVLGHCVSSFFASSVARCVFLGPRGMWDLCCLTRDWICIPCIERWCLKPLGAREVLWQGFIKAVTLTMNEIDIKGAKENKLMKIKKIGAFSRKTETTKNYQMVIVEVKITMYENLKVFGLD